MMDMLYNRNSAWIPGKSDRKREAQLYKKQPGLACAGAAGIQENLRSVCLQTRGEQGAKGVHCENNWQLPLGERKG